MANEAEKKPAKDNQAVGQTASSTATNNRSTPLDTYKQITEALKGPAPDDSDRLKKIWRIPGFVFGP